MTTYYVDPLSGATSNSGTSSGDAFASYANLYDGTLVGGLTLGDKVFLMASATDEVDQSFGNEQHVVDFGSTGGVIQFRAINPTTLEEDGTKYVLGARNNQYFALFGALEGHVYHNVTFVGYVASYTSGSESSFFTNCEFTDAAGGITYNNPVQAYNADNHGPVFRNCKMIKRDLATDRFNTFMARVGSVYGSGGLYESCEFINMNSPLSNQRRSSVINCRFKNCSTWAIDFEYRSNRSGEHQIINNIFDNVGHCYTIDSQQSSYPNVPKAGRFYGNLYNDVGGYIYSYAEPSATEINIRQTNRNSDNEVDWAGNVYQNVTSGVHSLPFGATFEARGWVTPFGDTAASFGLTHESDGTGLMVATGDNNTFNYFFTSAGLGVFLKEFTEAVVSGTVPEFGDVF